MMLREQNKSGNTGRSNRRQTCRALLAMSAAASGALLISHPVHAATDYWNGVNNSSTSAGWNTVGSWNNSAGATAAGAIPTSADTAYFSITSVSTSVVADLNANSSAGGLVFLNNSGMNVTIQSGANPYNLTLGTSGVVVNANAGAITINAPIAATSETWTNNAASMFTASNNVTGGTLTFAGTGSFTLSGSGDNSSTNGTVSSGTTLILGKTSSSSAHALGANAGSLGLLINSGGTAQLSGSGGDQIYSASSLGVNGTFDMHGLSEGFDGLAGTGNVSNSVASTTSVLTLGQSNNTGSYSNFGGNLLNGAGTLALVKVGTGTQTLSGSASTFTGGVIVSAGTLNLSNAGAVTSTNTINFNNTTGTTILNLAGINQTLANITFGNNGTVTAINGSGGASLTITGSALTFAPATGAGALTVNMTNLPSFIYNNNAGTLAVNAGSNAGGTTTIATTLSGTNNNITAGAIAVGNAGAGQGGDTSELFLGAINNISTNTINIGNGGGGREFGILSFASGISSGTVNIHGTTGGTTNLNIGGNNSFNGDGDVYGGTFNTASGSCQINASFGTMTLGNAISLTGEPGGVSTGTFEMGLGSITATTANVGNITGSSVNTSDGAFTSTGNLFILGGTASIGTINLGVDSAPTGDTSLHVTGNLNLSNGVLNATTIQLGSTTSGETKLTRTTAFNFVNGSIGNITGTNLSITGVPIILSGSTNTHAFNISSGQTGSVSSIISGAGLITDAGLGTLTFTGANTYSIGTNVSAGTLVLNRGVTGDAAASTAGTGPINVASGATLTLTNDELGYTNGSSETVTVNGTGLIQTLGTTSDNYIHSLTLAGGGTMNLASGGLSGYGANPTQLFLLQSVVSTGAGSTTNYINGTTGAITPRGTLAFNVSRGSAASDLTVGAIIQDDTSGTPIKAAVSKIGSGILTLTAANSYSSFTNISAGTLVVANATGSATGTSPVNVMTGGVLASATGGGTISGNVSVDATSSIAPGGVGTIGLLSIGGLTTVSGSTLNFDLGTGGPGVITNGDQLNIGSGTLSIGSGTNISFNTALTTAGNDYRLIGGSAAGNLSTASFAIPNAPAHQYYQLSNSIDPGYLDLIVYATGLNATLIWDNIGTGDGVTWDTTTQNWNNSGTAATFSSTNQDFVTFNDNNAGPASYNVNIPSLVTPGGTNVNTANTYVFSSNASGGIGGFGGLNVSGGGMLVLQTANSFTGPTNVSGATLDLANSNALLGSTLTTGGVTFDASVSSNAFTLGGLSGFGTITLQNTAAAPITLTVGANGNSTSFFGSLNGSGNLVKVGSGTLMLGGNSTYTGPTTINAGTLQLGTSNALPVITTLIFSGNSTLDLNSNGQSVAGVTVGQGVLATLANGTLGIGSGSVVFQATGASTSNLSGGAISISGATIDASAAGGASVPGGVSVTVASQITGIGGLTIKAFGNTSDNGGGNNSYLSLTNTNNNFTGGVNITSGLVNISPGDGVFGNGGSPSNNAITIAAGAGLIAPTNVTFNTSSIVLSGPGDHFVRVYGSTVATMNSSISGTDPASGLHMIDGGTTILAGSNTYTGLTTVNDGVVTVTGNESAATGGWTVGTSSTYTTTVNFNAGSNINVASGAAVTLGVIQPNGGSGTANQTLNVATGVNNQGTLNIGRTGFLQVNSGGTWNQSGQVNIQARNGSGYSAYLNVNSGGVFNYLGSTPINMTPSIQNGGYAEITLNGGTFNTNQGFVDNAYNFSQGNAYNSSGIALITLTGGGTLNLTANIPQLTTTNGSTFSIAVGNGSGGIINTNGFNTSIGASITNVSGGGILTKTGAGSLQLTGASSYSGGTNISSGTVLIGAGVTGGLNPLGTGIVTVGAMTGSDNASLLINGPYSSPAAVDLGNAGGNTTGTITIGNSTTDSATFSSSILYLYGPAATISSQATGSNALTFASALNLNESGLGTVTFAGPGNTNIPGVYSRSVVSAGAVIIAGSGNVTFTGSNASNYNQSTTILSGTMTAGAKNALSLSSAINISGGTLDVSGYNNSIPSLIVGNAGTLDLSITPGRILTDVGSATFGGTLNLSGTAGTLPEVLMNYGSYSNNFNSVTGLPSGDTLQYNASQLLLVQVFTGPATLIWGNGTSAGNGYTWDTTQTNWNNGTAIYSDNSNTSSGDNVIFDNTAANDNVTINTSSGNVNPTSVTFNNGVAHPYTIGGGTIGGPGSLTLNGGGTVTLNSSSTYTGGTFVNNGSLILGSPAALPANSNLSIGSVGNTSSVQLAAHATGANAGLITLNQLVMSGTTDAWNGVLDLTNNAMIVHNGSLGDINNMAKNGYAGGNWNGPTGIVSSSAQNDPTHLTAIGVATGDIVGSVEGVTVGSTDVVVKYTYYGDATLDGSVTNVDYTRIDTGYLSQGTTGALTGWENGDFNYDGVINGSDYTLIDNAFNMQGAGLSAEIAAPTAQLGDGVSAVPEPTTIGLLGFGAVGLLGRRNRRRH